MQVIPVIDLMGGQVVRGVAGRRSEYRPIQSRIAADARPETVAKAFVEQFGFETAYIADLDAIAGGAVNVEALDAIRLAGLKLWLDAGVADPQACSALRRRLGRQAIDTEIVLALESLQDPDAWLEERTRSQCSIFSLDLKHGVPVHRVSGWRGHSAIEIAHAAHARGFRNMIVLDIADVGVGQGTHTLKLCQQLIAELHPVGVIAGGGVRGIDDLKALADAGCDAALVASALHDGRLTREEIRQVQIIPAAPSRQSAQR